MKLSVAPIAGESVWEEFLQAHSSVALFQSWLWGETLKNQGHEMVRTGLYDNDKLVGIAQYTIVNARRGTFIHVRHGPCIAQAPPATYRAYWDFYLNYLRSLARAHKAWFIRVSPLLPNTQDNKEFFRACGLQPAAIHAMDAELCWVLDINKSEEELLAGMRKSTRYEIRQAQKLGVVVAITSDIKKFDLFRALYEKTSQRQGFVPHTGIVEEFAVFSKRDKAVLFTGAYEGNIVASAIVLFLGGQAIYHHGASLPTKVPVSSLVQWEAIREAKRRMCTEYNFYGIAPEDNPHHPWRGITLFKKGFGGRAVEYLHAHDLAVSGWYRIPRVIEQIRKFKKGY